MALNLQTTVSTGVITNASDGSGWRSEIDATAGGFTPTMSFVYARFTPTGLVGVPVSDLAALTSTSWDIAFRRYVIRLNGGDSGPGCVSAAATTPGTTYDSLSAEPAGLTFWSDDFYGPAPTCAFVTDGSGLGVPATALASATASYYQYTSCVAMTGRVFVVRTGAGRSVKLTVTRYYQTDAAQTSCNSSGSSGAVPGGYLAIRWQFLN